MRYIFVISVVICIFYSFTDFAQSSMSLKGRTLIAELSQRDKNPSSLHNEFWRTLLNDRKIPDEVVSNEYLIQDLTQAYHNRKSTLIPDPKIAQAVFDLLYSGQIIENQRYFIKSAFFAAAEKTEFALNIDYQFINRLTEIERIDLMLRIFPNETRIKPLKVKNRNQLLDAWEKVEKSDSERVQYEYARFGAIVDPAEKVKYFETVMEDLNIHSNRDLYLRALNNLEQDSGGKARGIIEWYFNQRESNVLVYLNASIDSYKSSLFRDVLMNYLGGNIKKKPTMKTFALGLFVLRESFQTVKSNKRYIPTQYMVDLAAETAKHKSKSTLGPKAKSSIESDLSEIYRIGNFPLLLRNDQWSLSRTMDPFSSDLYDSAAKAAELLNATH